MNKLKIQSETENMALEWFSLIAVIVTTIVVLIVSAIAAVILGVFDTIWSTITDLIYNV